MRLFKDRYYLRQDLEKVFDYFSKKAFLLRYFKPREIDRIWVESDGPDPYVKMGETVVLIIEGDSPNKIRIAMEPREILPYSRISFVMTTRTDTTDGAPEESFEFLMGKGLTYEMSFSQEGNRVRVEESSHILGGGVLAKGYMSLVSLMQYFRRKSTQQMIIQEIENLP